MKRQHALVTIFSLFILHFSMGTARTEPIIQSYTLNPGWNAIFLEVEPVWFDQATEAANPTKNPTDPGIVFTGITDLISVWMWNPNSGTVEYIQSPSILVPEGPQMLAYMPLENPIINNLHAIHGNYAYLINLGGTVPVNLEIRGEPLPPKIHWKPDSFNFVGFHLDNGPMPSFVNFFSSSAAHINQEIYVLDNATGTWIQISAGDTMQKGEGFWIYSKGSSEFQGPASLQLSLARSLDYGDTLEQQEITIKNDSTTPETISVSLADVGTLPTGMTDYPLFYWEFDPANNVAQWTAVPTGPSVVDITIAPGEYQVLRLGVKRVALVDGVHYTANLAFNNGNGTAFKVPSSITGISYGGLWVGEATIDKVAMPNEIDSATPRPTGSLFSYRLILHVNSSGAVNLLNQVIQMWQEGTWKTDPDDFSKKIIDEPGQFVLFSDDALVSSFSGASLRDGQPVGRRISSVAFGNLYAPDNVTKVTQKLMAGSFGQPDTPLTVSLFLPKDDPGNPFVHLYHPSHMAPDTNTPAEQIYEINRQISMGFSDTDSDGKSILGNTALGWGSSEIGGIYQETMSGLMKTAIQIQGVFVLRRVSDVDTLSVP